MSGRELELALAVLIEIAAMILLVLMVAEEVRWVW